MRLYYNAYPLLDDTKKMINKETLAMMKDGVVILTMQEICWLMMMQWKKLKVRKR